MEQPDRQTNLQFVTNEQWIRAHISMAYRDPILHAIVLDILRDILKTNKQ